jgi:hypothetical protein
VIRGASQTFEMNHSMDQEAEYEGEDTPARNNAGGNNIRDQEWAIELRKADQRSHDMRLRYEDLTNNDQLAMKYH